MGGGESKSERADSQDLGRGGNRGSRKPELRTSGVQALVTPLDLRGTNGTREEGRKVPKRAEKQGWSWRTLPRDESLRLRNSSGSLTS